MDPIGPSVHRSTDTSTGEPTYKSLNPEMLSPISEMKRQTKRMGALHPLSLGTAKTPQPPQRRPGKLAPAALKGSDKKTAREASPIPFPYFNSFYVNLLSSSPEHEASRDGGESSTAVCTIDIPPEAPRENNDTYFDSPYPSPRNHSIYDSPLNLNGAKRFSSSFLESQDD